MRIDGKVAGLVSPTQVTINAGASKGVKVGDVVTVYRKIDVQDPDSKQDLGSVALTKIKLNVSFVSERFCLADTLFVSDSLSSLWAGLNTPPPRMRVTTDQAQASSQVAVIAIGDPVFIESPPKPEGTEGRARADKPRPKPDSKPPAS
jgi:hypothetical protein